LEKHAALDASSDRVRQVRVHRILQKKIVIGNAGRA
jgi:hypothetical protein